jgi:hypothetical protein
MKTKRDRRMATGVFLILLGGAFYLLERSQGINAAAIFFIIGGAFFAAYLYRKEFGLLVPAGVLLGLGTGTAVNQTRYDFGNPVLWGLGLGFITIYVVSAIYERKNHWWPLIPGCILVLLGLPRVRSVVQYLFDNWPLILVVVGILFIAGGLLDRLKSSGTGSGS